MAELNTQEVRLKPSGFTFDLCARNLSLEKMGYAVPKLRKTGTTIVAALFTDGIVVGADSRATEGNMIADKYCLKVHHLTDSIYACGAGTAADLDQVSRMISSNLNLLELNTGRKARVIAALRIAKQHLFKYQGHVGAYMLIGGVDFYGPHLYSVHAHGSSDKLPYISEGSGSLAATGVLEAQWKENMTEADALKLVQNALEAGMHGDLASGNTLTLCVIKKDGTDFRRGITPQFCAPQPKDLTYHFPPDATQVMKSKELKFDVIDVMEVN